MKKVLFIIGVIFIIFLNPKQVFAETITGSSHEEINRSWIDDEYGDGHTYSPSYSNIGYICNSDKQIYLYYDYDGMNSNVVIQVLLDFLEIYEHFCSELGYYKPISGGSEKLNIYLDYKSEFANSKGYAQSDSPIFRLYYFGYIVINYDVLIEDIVSSKCTRD